MTTLPPAQYDVAYRGDAIIWFAAEKQDVRELCSKITDPHWSGLACALGTKDRLRCIIYRVKNDVLRAAGYHPNLVMRHEVGHCNGWIDHESGRKIFANEPVMVPEFKVQCGLSLPIRMPASNQIGPYESEAEPLTRQLRRRLPPHHLVRP